MAGIWKGGRSDGDDHRGFKMVRVYLSRTLLRKLDGVKEGIDSACTIIKNDTAHPKPTRTSR